MDSLCNYARRKRHSCGWIRGACRDRIDRGTDHLVAGDATRLAGTTHIDFVLLFLAKEKRIRFRGEKIGDNRWMRIFKIKEDCYLVNKRTDLRKVCTISRERAFIPNVLSLNNRLHLSIYMEHCWTSFTYFITRDETLTLQLPNKRKGKKGWSRKKRSWSNQITNQKSDTDFHVLLNLIQSSRPLLDSSQKSPSAHLPLIDNPLKQFLLPSIPSLSLFLYILYMYISLSLSF